MMSNSIVNSISRPASLPDNKMERDFPLGALAGFLPRFAAFVIDLFVLVCLHLFFFSLIALKLFQSLPPDIQTMFWAVALYLVFFLMTPPLFSVIYFSVLHAWGGQTVGKGIMGLRVVGADGNTITGGTAFLRWVGTLVSVLSFGYGFLWSLVDKESCAWHDRLAGTRVVDMRKILTRG